MGAKSACKEEVRYALRRLHAFKKELTAHRYTTVAGTLAFFLVLAVLPFLFWLTLLIGNSDLATRLAELELFGWARELVAYFAAHAESAGGGAGIFFLLTTLWSVSNFFYHLRRSGEIVYGLTRTKTGWRVRLSAVACAFAVLFYFAAAGACLAAATVQSARLPPVLGYPFRYLLLFFLGFLGAWILHSYVCPYRLHPRESAKGSLLTAALWLLFAAAFGVYLGFSGAEKLYGALSLAVAFLLFLYWMMICFVAGMVFTRVRTRGRVAEHKRL